MNVASIGARPLTLDNSPHRLPASRLTQEQEGSLPPSVQPPLGRGDEASGLGLRATLAGTVALLVTSRRSSVLRKPLASIRTARQRGRVALAALTAAEGPIVLLSAAAVGICTGGGVVVFEQLIHSIEDLRGLLPEPAIGDSHSSFAPLIGAALLAGIFTLMGEDGLKGTDLQSLKSYLKPSVKGVDNSPPDNWYVRSGLNAACAAITLGSGNSLGPEAPAAVLGANFAFGVSRVFALFDSPATTLKPLEAGDGQRAPGPEQRALIDRALQGSKVVDALEKDELDLLMTAFREVVVKAGDPLIRQGDDVTDDEPGLFITESGVLDVLVVADGGSKEGVDDLGKKVFTYDKEGMIIGELAVLFRGPRAATVVATTDSVLWSVDRASFEAAGGRSAGAMKNLALNPDSLIASGAAAGVAAGFNAPIAGIFFATEVVKPSGENSLDLTTRLLAAAISAAVCSTFLGGGPGIITAPDFSWTGGNVELIIFLVLGFLIGVVSYATRRCAGASRELIATIKSSGAPQVLLPFVGAIATVLISFLCDGRIMFDGFGALNEVLKDAALPLKEGVSNLALDPLMMPREDFIDQKYGIFTAGALFGLLVCKLVATSICQASGLVGGAFAPALFMGACVGGCVGRAVVGLKGVITISSVATYVVVGMAAQLAANCAVPITSVVLAVELVGGASYKAVLPLICCIGVAVYTASVLLPALLEGLDRKSAINAVEQYAEDTGI